MKKIIVFVAVLIFLPSYLEAGAILQVGAFADEANASRRAELIEEWGIGTEFEKSREGYIRVRTTALASDEVGKLEEKLNNREIPYFKVENDRADTGLKLGAEEAPGKLSMEEVVEKIDSVRGISYRWGGQSPGEGFDCSGLLYWIFSPLEIPRTVSEMWIWVDRIDEKNIRPGDFLFFRFDNPSDRSMPDHVGLYLGDDRFVHASEQFGVTSARLSREYYQKRLTGIGRPPRLLIDTGIE